MGDIFGTGKGRVDNTDESVQEILQAMNAYFPGVMDKIRGQYDPQARAEVGVLVDQPHLLRRITLT